MQLYEGNCFTPPTDWRRVALNLHCKCKSFVQSYCLEQRVSFFDHPLGELGGGSDIVFKSGLTCFKSVKPHQGKHSSVIFTSPIHTHTAKNQMFRVLQRNQVFKCCQPLMEYYCKYLYHLQRECMTVFFE